MFPLTFGVQAVREVAAGAGLGDVACLGAGMLGRGTRFFILAYALFSYFERQALKRGSLDMF